MGNRRFAAWSWLVGLASWSFAVQAADRPVEAEFSYAAIELEFAEPMQIWGNPLRRDLVRTTPELPLTCHWSDDVLLECAIEPPVKAKLATRYRIDLGPGLLTQEGKVLGRQVLHAETERPSVHAYVDRWEEGVPRFNIIGNMAMTAAEVRAVLQLRDGERLVPYTLEPIPGYVPEDDERRFLLRLSGEVGADARLDLRVTPGLRSAAGALRGEQDESLLSMRVNETFRVRTVSCRQRDGVQMRVVKGAHASLDCLPGEPIVATFSQMPDEASRARFAEHMPAGVTMGTWREGGADYWRGRDKRELLAPGAMLPLTIAKANTRVALTLDGLTTAAGLKVMPLTLDVRTTDARPLLEARGQRVLLDGSALPADRLQGINATGTPLRVTALGRDLHTDNVRVPAGEPNAKVTVSSRVDDRILREGGWTRWDVGVVDTRQPSYMRARSGVEFAAPDFDLAAWAGQREVVVWAQPWSDQGAIVGARVELLTQVSPEALPQAVVEAQTDADGVARLSLPQDHVLPETLDGQYPRWWIRATRGRGGKAERAVLSLGASQGYGLTLGAAPRRTLWGVSDRPLYVAGNTVQYQLWQRARVGGRLQHVVQPEPLELALLSAEEDKTLLRWQAMPDADGVIHGERALPVHLTDGTYCIGMADAGEESGACFFVGTYRAQDLWARAETEPRVLREGDAFVFDVEAGYYSGGPAAGMPLERISTMLTGLPLNEAYPRYADYTFIDVWSGLGRSGVALAPTASTFMTDASGKARIALPVAFPARGDADVEPPAFGTLQAVVEVKPSERESTVSNAAQVRYARHARYVGLLSEPRWWDGQSPLRLQAVVIDAQGNAVDAAPVEVQVDYLGEGWTEREEKTGQRVANCMLVAGQPTACDVPRKQSGRYRLVARSGDAAPATMTQYVWAGGAGSKASHEIRLVQARGGRAAGDPLTVELTQPQPEAVALFVFRQHGALIGHQVAAVRTGTQEIVLRLPPGTHGAIHVSVHIRDRGDVVAAAPGYRAAIPMRSASIDVTLPRPAHARVMEVSLRADDARPGQPARLVLTNTSARPRQVAVAVTDDALRAMAGEWLAYADPLGPHWLGREPGYEYAWSTGFHQWLGNGWTWSLPWPAASGSGADSDPSVKKKSAQWTSPLPPPPEAPLVSTVEPRPTDIVTPPSPAAPPAQAPSDGLTAFAEAGDATLDRIEVTGSRIDLTDVFHAGAQPSTDLRPREPRSAQSPMARVRTRFADTAFWQAGLVLAPGESRSFDVALPDNLTRWRAVAWSSDADDDFEQADATLEVGLPLEARLQAPVRLYPGDRARLAAHVRQAGDTAMPVRARIELQGDDTTQVDDGGHALTLAPRGQASIARLFQPTAIGSVRAVASVDGQTARDAVAAPIEIASPLVSARLVQAGWLDQAQVALEMPGVPDDAQGARLAVAVGRGGEGLIERWTRDLHAYPHRCWEQILSRAIGAALAIERGDRDVWPDATATVKEALDNAAVFQGEDGGMRYFAEEPGLDDGGFGVRDEVALTAYTLQAFGWLRARGHAVPPQVERDAREFLAARRLPAPDAGQRPKREPPAGVDAATRAAFEAAEAAAAAADAAAAAGEAAARSQDGVPGSYDDAAIAVAAVQADAVSLDGLWRVWDGLALPTRITGLRALAAARHPAASDALASVLVHFPERGRVRRIDRDEDWSRWMGSRMREQCALIAILDDHPELAGRQVRDALLRGLVDLYAGGTPSVDTQTGAYCLMAMHGTATSGPGQPANVQVAIGADRATLSLSATEPRARWSVPQAPRAGTMLTLAQAPDQHAWLGYVAELVYQEDASRARASAVGMSLSRRYEVLRAGRWQPLGKQAVKEGDWIRVTLAVQTASPRHFVALTDDVPGGLRPTDLALSAVAGLDLQQVSSTGSLLFRTRRLDPRAPKFYADYLPAGRHEVHYFARVANAGDYLAAPATAELMYGNASHARTASDRLRIVPASSP
jgi:uncharacterized protein YfaS (alpha-2-macroglobulin family)